MARRQQRETLTTGQAAELVGLPVKTIRRAFDLGRIGGFLMPGQKFRRLTRDQFRSFCVDNNIPTETLDADTASLTEVTEVH